MAWHTSRRGHRGARAAAGLLVALAGAVLSAPLATGPALAAGSGYGPAPLALPPGGVPGGFASVISAVGVTAKGKAIVGGGDGVKGRLVVPRGASPKGEQVVITYADARQITPALLRGVSAKVRHYRVLYTLGVIFQREGRPVANRKASTLTLTGKRFDHHDVVVLYAARRHGFVPAPRRGERLWGDHVALRVRGSTELAVLG